MYVPTTAPLVPLTGLTGLRTGLSAQRVQQLVAVIPCPPEIESLGYEVGNGACVGAAVVGAIEIRRLTQEGMQRSVSRASPSMEKMAIFYSVCRKWVPPTLCLEAYHTSRNLITRRNPNSETTPPRLQLACADACIRPAG